MSDLLRAGRSGFGGSILHRVQTGSGAHPTSYPRGTGSSFPGGKVAGTWSWPLTSFWCRSQECVELYLHSPIRLLDVVTFISSWMKFWFVTAVLWHMDCDKFSKNLLNAFVLICSAIWCRDMGIHLASFMFISRLISLLACNSFCVSLYGAYACSKNKHH